MENADHDNLPPHIAAVVRSIAQLHTSYRSSATPLQRFLTGITAAVVRPWFLAALSISVITWAGLNLVVMARDGSAIDPPPFAWLQIALSLGSLYMMLLVYATQRHDDRLAELREQLTLELAVLNEQKTAKMIELLEEFRRDLPIIENRTDPQANELAKPVDPQAVVEAIQETTADFEQVNER